MTLPRLQAFVDYWADSPPLHESVAALAFGIGVLKKTEKPDSAANQEAIAEYAQTLPIQKRARPA